jgi:hypothetical protein
MPLDGILPLCASFGSEDPQCGSGDEVALKVEGVVVSRRCKVRHAVREMKEDPSEPSCRGRLQTAMSCFGQKLG